MRKGILKNCRLLKDSSVLIGRLANLIDNDGKYKGIKEGLFKISLTVWDLAEKIEDEYYFLNYEFDILRKGLKYFKNERLKNKKTRSRKHWK